MGIYWLTSYPKSGNTWVRALLAHYLRDDVSLNALGSGRFTTREFMDECLGLPTVDLHLAEIENYLPAVCHHLARDIGEEPNFFKVHAANGVNSHGARLFPDDAGAAIHIVRNPLDVAASMIPFFDWPAEQVAATLADEAFVLNPSQADPFEAIPERLLSWSRHAASWMDCPTLRVITLRYEDLRKRPEAVFAEALRFAGIDPVAERVAHAVDCARIERLQSEERESGFAGLPAISTQPFFRQGKCGSWREELPADCVRRIVADHREMMLRLGYEEFVKEVEGSSPTN